MASFTVCIFTTTQLLTFYSATVQSLLGPHAQLAGTLRNAADRCKRLFSDQLSAKSEKLLRYPPPPPKDLSPPAQVLETVQQLAELLSSVEGTKGSAVGAMVDTAGVDVGPVVTAVVDALVETCERSSEALIADSPARCVAWGCSFVCTLVCTSARMWLVDKYPPLACRSCTCFHSHSVDEGSHLHPAAPRVFLINCFSLIESTMQGHLSLQDRTAQVGTALEAQIASLVGLETGRVLAACGLGDMVERVRWYAEEGHAGGGALSSDAALALGNVAAGLNALFDRVSDMHTLSDMDGIQVRVLLLCGAMPTPRAVNRWRGCGRR